MKSYRNYKNCSLVALGICVFSNLALLMMACSSDSKEDAESSEELVDETDASLPTQRTKGGSGDGGTVFHDAGGGYGFDAGGEGGFNVDGGPPPPPPGKTCAPGTVYIPQEDMCVLVMFVSSALTDGAMTFASLNAIGSGTGPSHAKAACNYLASQGEKTKNLSEKNFEPILMKRDAFYPSNVVPNIPIYDVNGKKLTDDIKYIKGDTFRDQLNNLVDQSGKAVEKVNVNGQQGQNQLGIWGIKITNKDKSIHNCRDWSHVKNVNSKNVSSMLKGGMWAYNKNEGVVKLVTGNCDRSGYVLCVTSTN